MENCAQSLNRIRRCRPLLGTYAEITLDGEAEPAELHAWAAEAFAAVENVHRLMSIHDSHSELSCLNSTGHLRPMRVHEWTRAVLQCACEVGDRSGGVFDVAVRSTSGGNYGDLDFHRGGTISFRRPLLLDVGGIAKGFAVDRAIDALSSRPLAYACVNAGGDLRILGHGPHHVDIRDPARPRERLRRVPLTHPAVATSAAYFRKGGDAILDPGTGRSVTAPRSVTVFAGTCMIADALTKVVMLADEETAGRVLTSYGASAVVLDTVHA